MKRRAISGNGMRYCDKSTKIFTDTVYCSTSFEPIFHERLG